MPLWKWIMLIVFGSALFLFLSQTVTDGILLGIGVFI